MRQQVSTSFPLDRALTGYAYLHETTSRRASDLFPGAGETYKHGSRGQASFPGFANASVRNGLLICEVTESRISPRPSSPLAAVTPVDFEFRSSKTETETAPRRLLEASTDAGRYIQSVDRS